MDPTAHITLVSASKLIKAVTNFQKVYIYIYSESQLFTCCIFNAIKFLKYFDAITQFLACHIVMIITVNDQFNNVCVCTLKLIVIISIYSSYVCTNN